ncbi:GNAT family N-acetyltransferase [Phenylobacterium aquaticum]|uniref:GNAT family N-acetyltransferase n=1 Tax=Phenylobacterium aquaticum TaxID=1763816 RepID=UPI0026E993C0|nr:GNAT family N-acetyltransferase [Phenylobacterium aquaticum]
MTIDATTLRPAAQDEAETLAAVHWQAFSPGWSAAELCALLEGPGTFALLAQDAGPTGMILCRAVAGEAEILTLAVIPPARRCGVAKALSLAAAGLARQAGAEEMFLEVAVDNLAALHLYEGIGFRRAGLRRGYYDREDGVRVDAAVMRLDLNSVAL